MSAKMQRRIVRRPSLPLTEQDEQDLGTLRTSPHYRLALGLLATDEVPKDVKESVLLHAIFEAGLRAVQKQAEEVGYAEIAETCIEEDPERRASARRRRPAWAEET